MKHINNLSETDVKILNKNKPTKCDKILDLVMYFTIFLFFVLFILWAMFLKERKKLNIRY
jgi:cell division septal protein FtsQ